MSSSERKYNVPASEKTMRILECLTQSRDGLAFKDIHTKLDLPKTTVFSILNTLAECGFIQKKADGRFVPTLKLYTMGINARDIINKQHSFLPYLETLRDKTGFTVFFAMYDNGEQIVLEKLNGFSSIVFRAYVGERKRMNSSAAGKAMAAYLSESELQIMFSKGFDRFTPNTIADIDTFKADMEKTRKNGYAIDDGEGEIGVRCIGLPVFTYGKRLYGAVSISTVRDNIDFADIPKYVKLVKETTEVISRELGYEGDICEEKGG